jgi:hypothetical protein
MKGVFANCSRIADDLPEALRTTDEKQMKIIYMLCSQKYEECKMNSMKQIREQMKNDQSSDHSPDSEEWKKRYEDKIVINLFNLQIRDAKSPALRPCLQPLNQVKAGD